MMVTFVSQCEKNSLKKTRRVLDSFANRIGNNVWQTVITQEGLHAVKILLKKTASKNTAVSCHWIRSRLRTDLLWVVGKREKFDSQGNIPVHSTKKNLLKSEWENDWKFLPLIKIMVALAALFHDFGKSWDHFQNMLKDNKKKDPIRHEWISLLLFHTLVHGKSDEEWLKEIALLNTKSEYDKKKFIKKIIQSTYPSKEEDDYPFSKNIPKLASWIGWLIVTHHKLPRLDPDNYTNENQVVNIHAILEDISKNTGYIKKKDHILKEKDWKFSHGLPVLSKKWCEVTARWTNKAQQALCLFEEASKLKIERLLLTLARLSLMLGDHQYSSKGKDENWQDTLGLYANTEKKDQNNQRPLRQKLDEHLVNVTKDALTITHLLPAFEKEFPSTQDISALRKASPQKFSWQDKAVKTLNQFKKTQDLSKSGFFAINMASTGCGKTFANAKIMHALNNDDSLRYNLALGLRTLTLQTGDEYRDRLKLDESELAILIGSSAVKFLHEDKNKTTRDEYENFEEQFGSASMQSLTNDLEITYQGMIYEDRLSTALKNKKSKQLLYAPVLVSTIDHLMPATESTRGGKHILPTLRLMSADLVIDEVDDFDAKDLPAISRLVHLTGMLGRKLMISSATIPPAIAEGLFRSYQAGWKLFADARQRQHTVNVFCLDEFNSHAQAMHSKQNFSEFHSSFVKQRIKKLSKANVRRRAKILKLTKLPANTESTELEKAYFKHLFTSATELHRQHSSIDTETQKRFSFGVIRVANINPCIQLTRFLLSTSLPKDTEIRVMPYHSRQVLLLRSHQEKHLDKILNRKDNPHPQNDQTIKDHLRACQKENLIFILVATPVEEVGRNHDLDWAVIEPSSLRSIIQMAGRVMRHRTLEELNHPNLILPEYNLKGFIGKSKIVFSQPGYEGGAYILDSKSLSKLLDESSLAKKVDASPRIQSSKTLRPKEKLDDLEHQVLQDIMTKQEYGPASVNGWIESAFYLSQLSQQCRPFRQSEHQETYKLHINEDNELEMRFAQQEDKERGKRPHHLKIENLNKEDQARLWLNLDYRSLIEEYSQKLSYSIERTCEFLGEVRLADKYGEREFSFIEQLGFETLI